MTKFTKCKYSFSVIALMTLLCCFEPPKYVDLSVPFHKQINPYSCGAACVQMWADYRGRYVDQKNIVNFMGNAGSTPIIIADVATFYCSLLIIADYFTGDTEEQNHSIADQLYSLYVKYPCIAIINNGWHAVILKKAHWHDEIKETPEGSKKTPIMDNVWYHDPDYSMPVPNCHASITNWKCLYQSCSNGRCYCTVIFAGCSSNPEAMAGYNEFRARGGTYYGERIRDRRKTREY